VQDFVLPTLINNDQTGFIAGRYIGGNIRLLFDIMEYAEENDIPGLFLNSKSVLFNDSSDPSKIIDVSSAN
jgi:hypothetical protein